MRSTFPRSNVLILGANSIQSLVPSTLVSQIEALLESHRIEDAVDLADSQRKKTQANILPQEDEVEELRYVYQRIGFQCLSETLFEDAGKNFFDGELDPRLLISYYPELRGNLFSATDEIDVFAGVAEHMPPEASIEDIVRNYSPHLAPNTRSAPPTAELRKILIMAANETLELFLTRHKKQGTSSPIVDTVLAKLYAQSEKTSELYTLLSSPVHQIILSELEPVLKSTGQYNALCMLYRQHGEDKKLLEVWAKLVEGEWTDDDIKDPLGEILTLVGEKRDRALAREWGVWVTKIDPERGLKMLMPKDSGKRRERPEEDLALLEQITEANEDAGMQYLEYLVLQRRSTSKDLHMRLLNACIDKLHTCLSDESISKLWRAKASSYASSSSPTPTSFLSYFTSTTPDTPHKRTRLKVILLLAGSTLYDPIPVRERITGYGKVLGLELAIINGKLGNHRAALTTLVHDLHDAVSAEAYCMLGGEVVPTKTARAIGESHVGLEGWVGAFFAGSDMGVGRTRAGTGAGKPVEITRQRSVSRKEGEEKRKELLRVLLEVYMDDGEASAGRAAHLLSSQAMNLDVLDVISLIPPTWPLNLTSSFLERSLRRSVHARHEGKIIKTLSAGQNLVVKDEAWLVLREEGMIIEEPLDGDENEGGEGEYDEKRGLVEKVVVHVGDGGLREKDGVLSTVRGGEGEGYVS